MESKSQRSAMKQTQLNFVANALPKEQPKSTKKRKLPFSEEESPCKTFCPDIFDVDLNDENIPDNSPAASIKINGLSNENKDAQDILPRPHLASINLEKRLESSPCAPKDFKNLVSLEVNGDLSPISKGNDSKHACKSSQESDVSSVNGDKKVEIVSLDAEGNETLSDEESDNFQVLTDKSESEVDVSASQNSSTVSTASSAVAEKCCNISTDGEGESKPFPKRLRSSTERKLKVAMQVKNASIKENLKVEKQKQHEEQVRLREQRRQEKLKAREERRLKKEQLEKEARLKKEQEKEEKKKQKLEKLQELEKEKEEKRKLKEEERLAKLQLLEEQKRKKQELLDAKYEEKKKKEEEKLKKLEEKKRAEEEEERKKEKAKAAFVSFFVKNASSPSLEATNEQKVGKFLPFEVMKDVTLAPVVPVVSQEQFSPSRLDDLIKDQDKNVLYLEELKNGKHQPFTKKERVEFEAQDDNDVIVVDTGIVKKEKLKAKLFQFCENERPPYWGTWRKRSRNISGRRPFGKEQMFDYEVDSDDEWEEEEPGESLSGTEDEKESEDEYELDEVFVPHGYLSSDEEKEDNDSPATPETLKARLKVREQEFEEELKQKKFKSMKPICFGCIWENGPGIKLQEEIALLNQYRVAFLRDTVFIPSWEVKEDKELDSPKSVSSTPASAGENGSLRMKKTTVPEEAIPDLIRMLHRSNFSCLTIIKKFQESWKSSNQDTQKEATDQTTLSSSTSTTPSRTKVSSCSVSKSALRRSIKNIANWDSKAAHWIVQREVIKKYGLEDLLLSEDASKIEKKNEPKKPPKKCKLITLSKTTSFQQNSNNGNSVPSIKKFIVPIRVSKDKSMVNTAFEQESKHPANRKVDPSPVDVNNDTGIISEVKQESGQDAAEKIDQS